jgi:hypothetical protein
VTAGGGFNSRGKLNSLLSIYARGDKRLIPQNSLGGADTPADMHPAAHEKSAFPQPKVRTSNRLLCVYRDCGRLRPRALNVADRFLYVFFRIARLL